MAKGLSKEIIQKITKISKNAGISIQTFLSTGNANDIPMEILKIHFNNKLNNKKQVLNNMRLWRENIAPVELITEDINEYSRKILTLPSCYLATNFIPRSTIGHAHAGHCAFQSRSMINTTLDDVISDEVLLHFKKGNSPIYFNRYDFLLETQNAIDTIANLVHDAVENPSRMMDVTQGGIESPIFGIPFWNKFDSQALLKGIFYAGYFDNYDTVRIKAEKKYNIDLGGGESYIINHKLIQKLGINVTDLTSADYQDEILNMLNSNQRIELFKNLGIIMDVPRIDFSHVTNWNDVKDQCINVTDAKYYQFFQEYIRTKKGQGISDDIACMAAAFIDFNPQDTKRDGFYYKSLSNGANMNDFIDTLSKASLLYAQGGLDQAISDFANHMWLRKIRTDKRYRENHNINLHEIEQRIEKQGTEDFALVSLKELSDLAAICKNPMENEIHSSARYFIRMFDGTYALEQEAMINQRRLKSFRANVKVIGEPSEYLIGENIKSQIPIGFNKIKLNNIILYLDKSIYPILSDPANRSGLIEKRYASEQSE
ncbi:hypothetical protein JXM83_03445 [Candidatus Woesearchaeota archaeon]|nr:hypothetical protein [Candidatus Woesearchaeota archaeon]